MRAITTQTIDTRGQEAASASPAHWRPLVSTTQSALCHPTPPDSTLPISHPNSLAPRVQWTPTSQSRFVAGAEGSHGTHGKLPSQPTSQPNILVSSQPFSLEPKPPPQSGLLYGLTQIWRLYYVLSLNSCDLDCSLKDRLVNNTFVTSSPSQVFAPDYFYRPWHSDPRC